MYSEIILCLDKKEDDVLTKQLAMLSERHHAAIKKVDAATAENAILSGAPDILLISDNEELLSKAKAKGIATNTPAKMRESYAKAMEMLKALGSGTKR